MVIGEVVVVGGVDFVLVGVDCGYCAVMVDDVVEVEWDWCDWLVVEW